jgi:hypothetical protein
LRNKSLTTAENIPESNFNHQAKEYAFPITRKNFEAQAVDIVAELSKAAKENVPRQEGYKRTYEAYVSQEENDNLRAFSEVLLGARRAEAVTKSLDSIRTKVELRAATPDERNRYHELRSEIINYNHKLRDFIWENPFLITKADMKKWLEQSGSGDSRWVDRTLNGMSAEIAVGREIQRVPGVHEVRMSTPEEDAKGADIVAALSDGSTWNVDVKSGQRSIGYMPRTNGMEIGVDNKMLSGFAVSTEYQKEIQGTFASAVGLDHHSERRAA